MPVDRYSPDWHRGDAATFSRLVGVNPATPIAPQNPVHAARIERYERNIEYYLGTQYSRINLQSAQADDFLNLRVNYSSIAKRSIDMKADWLFGKPVGVNAIPLQDRTDPTAPPTSTPDGNPALLAIKDRINQIREYNHSIFWDYVMAQMGMICGDFFVVVDAEVDDEHPSISLVDPSYVFPDYPNDINKPMRACQIQYVVDFEGDPVQDEHEPGLRQRHIVEDYRLEVVGSTLPPDRVEGPTDLPTLTDEELAQFYQDTGRPRPEVNEEGVDLPDPEDMPKLTCIYRKFEDSVLVEGSQRDIGIPAIPIVHGLNSRIWNTRYGVDEISNLIPLIEKYNEMFFYAERVGRQNAHAKLFINGVKSDTNPIKSDYDDVIYGGDNADAKVISLPTDTAVLKMVTEAIERETHRAAGIPVIAEGEAEVGYGAPSGLALLIRFGPLQQLTDRHHLVYGDALSAVYVLCLMFDEMVIQGMNYGDLYDYGSWKFKFDWYDAMPKAFSEIVADMSVATGGKQFISTRTAQEMTPGIDPDQEAPRLQEDAAMAAQQSLNGTLANGQPVPTGTQTDPALAALNGSGG